MQIGLSQQGMCLLEALLAWLLVVLVALAVFECHRETLLALREDALYQRAILWGANIAESCYGHRSCNLNDQQIISLVRQLKSELPRASVQLHCQDQRCQLSMHWMMNHSRSYAFNFAL